MRLWTPFSPQHPIACLFSHIAGVVGVAIAEESRHLFSLAQDLVSSIHTHILHNRGKHSVSCSSSSTQSLCVWDIREHHLLQTVSVKFPFTQRLPDFGPSPLSLLPFPCPTLTVSCNEYIARFTLNLGIDEIETHLLYGTGHCGLCLPTGLIGALSEGARLDVSHTHPICAVAYCPLLDQLVRKICTRNSS